MCPEGCVGSTGVDAHAVQQTPPLLLADRNTPLSHVIYSALISATHIHPSPYTDHTQHS